MVQHGLKEVGETIEYLRRYRKDMPQGKVRGELDRMVVRLASHVEQIVAEDERLTRRREAIAIARAKAPTDQDWSRLETWGTVDRVVGMIINGTEASTAWVKCLP